MYKDSNLSTTSPAFVISCIIDIIIIICNLNGCEAVSHCYFDIHFPNTRGIFCLFCFLEQEQFTTSTPITAPFLYAYSFPFSKQVILSVSKWLQNLLSRFISSLVPGTLPKRHYVYCERKTLIIHIISQYMWQLCLDSSSEKSNPPLIQAIIVHSEQIKDIGKPRVFRVLFTLAWK